MLCLHSHVYVLCVSCLHVDVQACDVCVTHSPHTRVCTGVHTSRWGPLLNAEASSLSFQQAKKGLLTLTVRTRLTAPRSLSSALSPPLCRSLSSSSCVAKAGSPFLLDAPPAPASTARPSYRVMVEVSLRKGRRAAGAFHREG